MTRIMVVGASGVLGKLVCDELLRIFNNELNLVITDYKTERGKKLARSFNNEVEFRYLDVNSEECVMKVIKDIDIVIVVIKQQNPNIQNVCITRCIICIDVTPFFDFVGKVKRLEQNELKNGVCSIVMSGFFPGLSGLMIKKVATDFDDITEINVGLLQNTNAKAGLSGILDMLKIISHPVYNNDNIVAGFTKKRKLMFLGYDIEHEVRLIEHAEKNHFYEEFKTRNINYWTSWNNEISNALISLLRKIGVLDRVQKFNENKLLANLVKHNPNKNEHAYLSVEVKGIINKQTCVKTLAVATFSDYYTTAMVTATLAKIVQNKEIKGVVLPSDITNFDEIIAKMNCPDITFKEINRLV
ncbi:saccharopine dehydrogenase NADP-binding domain-containing protein [Bacillus solimangrovi]|uniref:Saccharopine dehydrogenase NADP binding domain-containing protein n=1 Tax=Bacillus solimangrovi TaxID=1305675 RepID=A0A1E5LHU0_9BACI|nr:saccharopine dehydrogenase NADP-binding domain-containing protein [Bacillus solimangrovi]OEH93637.1 hypothetical protein BFG57_01225 [Bacillus solimangrovi]